MTITDTEIQEKIKIFITKLDRMDSRVREVEAVAAKLPKLEATLSKISLQVDKIEHGRPSGSFGGQGFMTIKRMAIGLFLIGLIVVTWLFMGR